MTFQPSTYMFQRGKNFHQAPTINMENNQRYPQACMPNAPQGSNLSDSQTNAERYATLSFSRRDSFFC